MASSMRVVNDRDSFFISSAGKFDSQYGRWKIRAKLPFNVQSLTRIGLINSHCEPPGCVWDIIQSAFYMSLDPDRPSVIDLAHPYGSGETEYSMTNKLLTYSESFHTYEFLWTPNSLEWRIDGKDIASIFDRKGCKNDPLTGEIPYSSIPWNEMSPYISVFCGRNHSQVFDEDSTLTISSITYTPLSPSMLAQHKADSTPCPLDPWASTTRSPPATQSTNSTDPQAEGGTQPTAPARDEEDSGVPTTSANSTSVSLVDLVADQIKIVAAALSNIDHIKNYMKQQKTVDGKPDTSQTEAPAVIRP